MTAQSSDLQSLLDRAAIHDVYVRYFQGVDSGYVEQVRDCFTDDLRAIHHGVPPMQGLDQFMDWLEPYFQSREGKGPGGFMKAATHFLGNLIFERLDGDEAEVEAYALSFLVRAGDPDDVVEVRGLRYLDRLRRDGHRWQICDRRHTLDWTTETKATFAATLAERVMRRPAMLTQR